MALLALLIVCQGATAATTPADSPTTEDAEIASLRQELAAVKRDYDSRIAELEARLASIEDTSSLEETAAAGTTAVPAVTPTPSVAVAAAPVVPSRGNAAFNPAIGVIFQGQAWDYSGHGEENAIPGYPAGGEAGPIPKGLALGETEIDANANVDNLFTAWLTTALVPEDGEIAVEIEEAWVETLGLPLGFSTRFGRFYSDVGYLNGKHSHTWDFADQPLAYKAFLGNQYGDDGIQVRWLAPTDLYLELGGEVFRGDHYPAAGAANGGLGSNTLFAKLGGDAGVSSSWLTGISYLHARSDARPSGPEDEPLLFDGTTDMVIAEFVWKWAPNGNWRRKNLVLQSELLWRNENGRYLLPDGSSPDIDRDQWGWYAQVVYQPITQWRVGARFDLLSNDDPGPAFAGTALDPLGSDPKRYTVMADWSPSEFSRLRLQYAWDDSGIDSFSQWGLQYIQSIGAHGAHTF
ncbi:MAG: hypothetical protein PVH91_10160 [Pseudomonadales bacterium]|jgi:hypothetical protein